MSHRVIRVRLWLCSTLPAAPHPKPGVLTQGGAERGPRGPKEDRLIGEFLPPLGGGLDGAVPSISSKASL